MAITIRYHKIIPQYEYKMKEHRKAALHQCQHSIIHELYPYIKAGRHIEIVELWYKQQNGMNQLWCCEVTALIEGEKIKEEDE